MTEPLVDVTGARRRRTAARLRRRLTVVGTLAGVVTAVAGGAWLMGSSDVFSTDEVVTDGLAILTHDQVVEAAAVPLGAPLGRLDADAVEDRVRQLPAVADVDVSARYPHTVVVRVTERVPVLDVVAGTSHTWVDGAGVAFHESDAAPEGAMTARGVLHDADLLAAYAEVLDDLPPGVREEAEAVTGRTPDSISLLLEDGRRVVWGSPEDGELKADVLGVLMSVEAEVYDVSAPGHPTTR